MRIYCLWFVTVIFTIAKESKSHSIISKIVGGELASINETKYQASIRVKKENKPFGSGHICGGTAISYKTILTAAHCLFGPIVSTIPRLLFPHEIFVVMGSTKLNDSAPPTLIFDIREMDIHRKYRSVSAQYDVGLLFLEGEIPVGHPTVQPIPISSRPLQEGRTCRVSGWGYKSEDEEETNDLLIITVKTLELSTCRARFSTVIHSPIRKGMFCTEGKKHPHHGDSGGPVICDNEVVGIASWIVLKKKKHYPSGYTDVYYFRDWILENGAHSINVDFVNFKIASLLTLLLIVKQWFYFNGETCI